MDIEFLQHLPPSLIMILGSLLFAPAVRYQRLILAILFPVLTLMQIWIVAGNGAEDFQIRLAGFTLSPLHIHPYTLIFATIFTIAAGVTAFYGAMQAKGSELVAGFIYAGSAIGLCYSGDFITMFIYWEIMAIASCFIIFSSNAKFAGNAGVRYAIMHFLSGVLLLGGIIAQIFLSGSSELVNLNADIAILFPGYALDMNGVISWLVLLGLLIGVAAPPFSAWLPDSYPKASVSGSVFLCAFTTKAAIFLLIVLFTGAKILIFFGLVMVLYGVIYAILENNIRRMLAYSIINQVGIMVVGIGIGTEMALNGVALYAFCHIIYKALLFMVAGSVVHATGKNRFSEVGSLFRFMPVTAICGIIGVMVLCAFPLTLGFISKSVIFSAASEEGLSRIWFLLLASSAGACLIGIKFIWFIFFGKDSDLQPKEAPFNMQAAMVIMALLCIIPAIPAFTTSTIYNLLSGEVVYKAYTAEHILTNLQLFLFSALAFFIMLPLLKTTSTISLDFDWFYRGLARYIVLALFRITIVPNQFVRILIKKGFRKVQYILHHTHGPGSVMARGWEIGTSALWTIVLLGIYLAIYYKAR